MWIATMTRPNSVGQLTCSSISLFGLKVVLSVERISDKFCAMKGWKIFRRKLSAWYFNSSMVPLFAAEGILSTPAVAPSPAPPSSVSPTTPLDLISWDLAVSVATSERLVGCHHAGFHALIFQLLLVDLAASAEKWLDGRRSGYFNGIVTVVKRRNQPYARLGNVL